jgi:hypothetical protein
MKITWTEIERMEQGKAVKTPSDMDLRLFREEMGNTAA